MTLAVQSASLPLCIVYYYLRYPGYTELVIYLKKKLLTVVTTHDHTLVCLCVQTNHLSAHLT